jgi:L-lactate dehydrogenase (cytochrome)
MIILGPIDYHKAAERCLPIFLFDYLDRGAVTECTTKQNVDEHAFINLRQRVLSSVGTPSLEVR